MSKLALDGILDEYRAQRRYREAKRNEYLRRFEVLRQNFAHIHHLHPTNLHQHEQQGQQLQQNESRHQAHPVEIIVERPQHHQQHTHPHHQHHHHQEPQPQEHSHRHEGPHHHNHQHVAISPPVDNPEQRKLQTEEADLLRENEALKKSLIAIEVEERDRLQAFKGEIEEVRNKYLEEIKKLTETAKSAKEQTEAKMEKIKQQNEAATLKNKEIAHTNTSLRAQLTEGNALMGQYATQIKKEYSEKIGEFEKIFNSSNEKIEAMQREFNEDEFIQNTLKNQELLKSIEQNAEKAEQAGKILEDYGTLLTGKQEILTQIRSNVEMKEREIEKMVELQGKMKLIMEKLTTEKKIYVAENNKMAEELMEIKNLLVGVMNEAK